MIFDEEESAHFVREGWVVAPPTVIDPEPGPPAELDALGRRLLGLDSW
jgi:hypothetical protein